jgi:UDP-N-acetylglucosamine 2-epimerase (non-hydrolysing)
MHMKPFRIFNIVGARPNFMKIAPLLAEMRKHSELSPILVHTGQHYDYQMSQVFFDQLGVPKPDYNLEVGSGTHHEQTAEVMKRFGELVERDRPDLIVVVGDVNSTMACALVAAKEMIPLAHVEAGLRSFDRGMPEEVNRVVADAVSDLLFTTEESGGVNLRREGIAEDKIFFVGNVMIDSLIRGLESARQSPFVKRLGLPEKGFAVLTLHRPSNVDDPIRLRRILDVIADIAQRLPVIFPVHPRTAAKVAEAGIRNMKSWNGATVISSPGIYTMAPAAYLDFIGMVDRAALVITDSGGIQEETSYLGIPCLTLRANTERPVTLSVGTNRLVGTDPENLRREAFSLLDSVESRTAQQSERASSRPRLWDGHASERIFQVLMEFLEKRASQ